MTDNDPHHEPDEAPPESFDSLPPIDADSIDRADDDVTGIGPDATDTDDAATAASDFSDPFASVLDEQPGLDASDSDFDDAAAGPRPGQASAFAGAAGATAPPPPMRRIYRSPVEKKLGGVSGGIAEFFRVDPTLVRLGWLIFAITGVGILAYIAAWIIVPVRPESFRQPAVGTGGRLDRNTAIAMAAIGGAALVAVAAESWFILAAGLVIAGVWILNQPPQSSLATVGASSPAAAAPYVAPPPRPTPQWQPQPAAPVQFSDGSSGENLPPPPSYASSAYVPEPEPVAPAPKKPNTVTRVVLSLLMLLASVGAIAAVTDWDASATRFVGGAVAIIGGGVVVGALRGGGARGLIPLGLLATLALVPVAALDGLIDDGVGERTYRPTTLAELEEEYSLGIGHLMLDLSRLDLGGETRIVNIEMGVGHAEIRLPRDAGGSVEFDLRVGEAELIRPGQATLGEDGLGIDVGPLLLDGDNGEIILIIDQRIGYAEVYQR